MMYTVKSNELEGSQVGAKALRLTELIKLEVPVPDFVVVPADVLVDCYGDRAAYVAIAKEMAEYLPADHYAVRSAALHEDGKDQSMAGRFKSVVPVVMGMLPTAIGDVLDDAMEKLGGLEQFSLMIQVVVEPEYSGVIFTRDPYGAPEMVIAYTDGYGEKVVGGNTVHTVRVFDQLSEKKVFPGMWELHAYARSIEAYYEFPQDIEFVVAGGQAHVVQSRPITSISSEQWAGITCIEELELTQPYYLAQDTLAESFAQTSTLGFSLLEYLYRADGPVMKAYEARGVRMTPGAYFRHIGGSVYIDKEKEAHSIYPAFGYFRKQNGVLHMERMKGMWQSLKNFHYMHKVDPARVRELQEHIDAFLVAPLNTNALLSDRLAVLDEVYAYIFEINLIAQTLTQRVQQAFGAHRELFADVVAAASGPDVAAYPEVARLQGVEAGNSIALDDHSVFSASVPHAKEPAQWVHLMPGYKQKYLQEQVQLLQQVLALREAGRFASVRVIEYVREVTRSIAGIHPQDVYHYTIDELLHGGASDVDIAQRAQATKEAQVMVMPPEIMSFRHSVASAQEGLAAGVGEGVVVHVAQLGDPHEHRKILLVQTLSPDLAPVLLRDDLAGIITLEGNILSHMAIVAREQGVPVVRTSAPPRVHDTVRIHGGSGVIESI